MHLQLWQLVGLYQEDSLPAWLAIRLAHGSSSGSEHPVLSLCRTGLRIEGRGFDTALGQVS